MKKGFTLIELLAVIIILAVIAIIATPIVLNTIDDAKNSARESKLRLYADSVKLKATNTYFTNDGDIDGSINTIDINNSSTSCDNACYSQGKVFLENCSVDGALGYYYINGNIYNNIEDYGFALDENEYSKCSPLEANLITSIPTATGGSVALASTTYNNKNYDEENKYLTFYTVAYVTSDNLSTTGYQYSINLNNLPVAISSIKNVTVVSSSVMSSIEDFNEYNRIKSEGGISETISSYSSWAKATSEEMLSHSATSSQLSINSIGVTCTSNCVASINASLQNLSAITFHSTTTYGGSNIEARYLPIKFTIKIESGATAQLPNLDTSGANVPEMATNMIPIMYSGTSWVKADSNNASLLYPWYDYNNKNWANAVTVTSATLDTYKNSPLGTVIPEADILTYLVWVPRYKYAIPVGSGARTMNIVFESSSSKTNGTAIDTNYLTHPSFTFGTKELSGFWIGKFETSVDTTNSCYTNPTTANCNKTSLPLKIKPNVKSWNWAQTATEFTSIRKMELASNIYGFVDSEVDTHMILNSEWGAVAYLSMSTYGINSEIYKNNSNSYYTGRSGGNVGGSQVKAGSNEYYDTGYYTYDGKCATTTTLVPGINSNCTAINNMVSDTLLSYKASTTGNITGVYDMSGGAYEYVMGNFNNYSGFSSTYNSNFNGLNWYNSTTVTTGFDFPDARYYNLYTTSTLSTACAGLKCYGHALSETSTWYSDSSIAVSASSPWFVRGGDRMETTGAGIFGSGSSYGHANLGYTTRVVVALTNQ